MLRLTYGSDEFILLLTLHIQEEARLDGFITKDILRLGASGNGLEGRRFDKALDSVTKAGLLVGKKHYANPLYLLSPTYTYEADNPVLDKDYVLGEAEDAIGKVYASLNRGPDRKVSPFDLQEELEKQGHDYPMARILHSLYVLQFLGLVGRRGESETAWAASTIGGKA